MTGRGWWQLWQQRARRIVRQHKFALLALTAPVCFVSSAVSGWGAPPASWQIVATVCGCALTFSAYLASQQSASVATP